MSSKNTLSPIANNDMSPSQSEEDTPSIDISPCTALPDEKNIMSPCLSSSDSDSSEIRGHKLLYSLDGIEESANIDDSVHPQSQEIDNVCSQIDVTSENSKDEHEIDDTGLNNSQCLEMLLGMDQSLREGETLTLESADESKKPTSTDCKYEQFEIRNEEDSASGDTVPECRESTYEDSPVSCSDSSSQSKESNELSESSSFCMSQQENEARNGSAFRIGIGDNVSEVLDEGGTKENLKGKSSELSITSVDILMAEENKLEESDNIPFEDHESEKESATKREKLESIGRISDSADISPDRKNLDLSNDNIDVPTANITRDLRADESNIATTTITDHSEEEHESVPRLLWRNPRHQLFYTHSKSPFWRQSSDGENICKAETPTYINTNYEQIEERGIEGPECSRYPAKDEFTEGPECSRYPAKDEFTEGPECSRYPAKDEFTEGPKCSRYSAKDEFTEAPECSRYSGGDEFTLQNEKKDSQSISAPRENASVSNFKFSKTPESVPHTDTITDPGTNIASIIRELQRMSIEEDSVFESVTEKHEDETGECICSSTDGKSPTEESCSKFNQVVKTDVERPDTPSNIINNTRKTSLNESVLPRRSDGSHEREVEELKNNTTNISWHDDRDNTYILVGGDKEPTVGSIEKHQRSGVGDQSATELRLPPVKETEENLPETLMTHHEANETKDCLKDNVDSPCRKHVSFCLDECNTVISFPSTGVPLSPNSQHSNESKPHQTSLHTTYGVKPLSPLRREGRPLSADMSGAKVTWASRKAVSVPLDSMSFCPGQPTEERLLGAPNNNETQEPQNGAKGATNTGFVLDTPGHEHKNGGETFEDANPQTTSGADPPDLAIPSEVIEKLHSLVFPSKPPRRPQSMPLQQPTGKSMLAAKVLGWQSLDKNASEITPLRSGVPTECVVDSAAIDPNGITEDESEVRQECSTPSDVEVCDGYMNPEDDTLSLEFFVPVKKTYIRLHRRTFIAFVLKYSIFFFTFLFWFASLSGIAFGTWMLTRNSAVIDDITDVFLDPYALLCVVSGIIFLVAFFGCVGVLRENIYLLKIFHISLTAVLVLEALLGTLVFVFYAMPDFRHAVKVGPEEVLKKAVKQYFDDDGMKNWIDLVQKEFQCCGVSLSDHGYLDWQENMYFNCSDLNRSVYRCSVPLSCCIFEAGDMINYMCGAGIIKKEWTHIQRYINTKGCMKTFGEWLSKNDALIGYTALGILVPQVLGVVASRYYIKNLRKQRGSYAD